MFPVRLKVVMLCAFFFLLFSVVSSVSARSGSIPLLAVTEGSGAGLVAELELSVVSGSGEVFLNTYPLTKLSTQLSLRVAVDQACQELLVDCSKSDFMFTIRAPPGIVGGPSAGGAAAVLTAEVVGNLSRKYSSIVMTGTINTGGVIGPVGGYEEKIQAAARQGFKTVLVPKGALRGSNFSVNATVNITEVGTLRDVLERWYVYSPIVDSQTLLLSTSYAEAMRSVAEDLCKTVVDVNVTSNASSLLSEGKAYSAASLCFRSNIDRGTKELSNVSAENRSALLASLRSEVETLEKNLSSEPKLKSYAGIQSFLSVQERVSEAKSDLGENSSSPESLSYIRERLRSARSWASVHDGGKKVFSINDAVVNFACADSIESAEQVVSYVDSFAPGVLQRTGATLQDAGDDQQRGDFVLCVFRSLKAKAEANALLSQVGVDDEETMRDMLNDKLGFVKRSLIRAVNRGMFPTIGYSYYEYALTLEERDPGLSLLFSEYALEFSELDRVLQKQVSFPKSQVSYPESRFPSSISWEWFGVGVLVGGVVVIVLSRFRKGSLSSPVSVSSRRLR